MISTAVPHFKIQNNLNNNLTEEKHENSAKTHKSHLKANSIEIIENNLNNSKKKINNCLEIIEIKDCVNNDNYLQSFLLGHELLRLKRSQTQQTVNHFNSNNSNNSNNEKKIEFSFKSGINCFNKSLNESIINKSFSNEVLFGSDFETHSGIED